MKKLVVFGFDGTLADTAPGILYCFNTTAVAMGYEPVEHSALYGVIGTPLEYGFKTLFNMSDDEIEKRCKELSYLKIPPREQAENKLILSMGESLYEETVGNLRKEVEFYLRKFESLLDNQDKNDISLVAKEIKEKFEVISNSIKCYWYFIILMKIVDLT